MITAASIILALIIASARLVTSCRKTKKPARSKVVKWSNVKQIFFRSFGLVDEVTCQEMLKSCFAAIATTFFVLSFFSQRS